MKSWLNDVKITWSILAIWLLDQANDPCNPNTLIILKHWPSLAIINIVIQYLHETQAELGYYDGELTQKNCCDDVSKYCVFDQEFYFSFFSCFVFVPNWNPWSGAAVADCAVEMHLILVNFKIGKWDRCSSYQTLCVYWALQFRVCCSVKDHPQKSRIYPTLHIWECKAALNIEWET